MTTCEPLPDGGEDEPLTLFAAVSPASPSASRGSAKGRRIAGGYGPRSPQPFARYDPATSSWRTLQGSLLSEWEMLSETWPRSGMTRNGTAYRRAGSVPPIYANGSSLWPTPVYKPGGGSALDGGSNSRKAAKRRGLWPTPTAGDSRNSRNATANRSPGSSHHPGTTLSDAIRMLPTPTANRWDGLQSHGVNVVTGQLNPTWVEWLMGYPPGWTDCWDSGTPSFPRSPSTSDGSS